MGHLINWAPFLYNKNSLNYVPDHKVREGLKNLKENPSIHWPFSNQLLRNPSLIKYSMDEFVRLALRWGWDIGPFREVNSVIMLRTLIELRRIITVSESIDQAIEVKLNEYGIELASSVDEALKMAYKRHGNKVGVTVVPSIDDFY
jgi:hypothetical protein